MARFYWMRIPSVSQSQIKQRMIRHLQSYHWFVAIRERFSSVWNIAVIVRRLASNYLYDLRRYLSHSGTCCTETSAAVREAQFIAQYHKIEHGLSLQNTRVGFGRDTVERLVSRLEEQQATGRAFSTFEQSALQALFGYYRFNVEHGLHDDKLYCRLQALLSEESIDVILGGVERVTKKEVLEAASINFKEFVEARHSIRNFATDEVAVDLLRDAVSIARGSPSVSNRQSWKVHVYSGEACKRILSHQDGNRGFGHLVDKVLIITADLGCFFGVEERNQCFIDGGMFAMSLLYALHALKVGACSLGWCVTQEFDQALRQDAGIAPSETIIMLIAVGHLPEQFFVPRSVRRNIDSILVFH